MINSKEISVIVQGAIHEEYTPMVINSIRKYLPKAELILSTWKNSKVENLDYDTLIENIDPGAEVLFPQWGQKHNLNRQIISTLNGIKKAQRKYVLKIRTDILLKNNHFLLYFDKFNDRCETCKILNKRVIICNYYARHPEVFPFHISDWVMFGLKEDILNIWNIPIAPEPETTKWFYSHNLLRQHLEPGPYSHFRHRYCAEQYIWASFLKKYIDLNFDNMFDNNIRNIEYTKISFANNLVIISPLQFGIIFLKNKIKKENDIYNFIQWQELYRIYCNPNYKMPFLQKLSHNQKYNNLKNKLKKHLNKVFVFTKYIADYFSNILSVLFYLLKIIKSLIFACFVRQQSSDQKMIEKISDKINKSNIKNVNIIQMANGESFILANLMSEFNKIFLPNETAWITTNKNTKKIMDAYAEDQVKYLNLKLTNFRKSQYNYKKIRYNIFLNDDFWFDLWSKKEHFIEKFVKTYNINAKYLTLKKPEFNDFNEEFLLQKIRNIHLNIDNFVFISPEANSMSLLPMEFWEKITHNLQKQGYDVFNNIINDENKIKDSKSCFITIEEAYYLASKAKRIIGLRSGFLELFLTLDIPMSVIYNCQENCNNPFLINIVNNYTLLKYPYKNKEIKEYYFKYNKSKNIIADIAKNVKSFNSTFADD